MARMTKKILKQIWSWTEDCYKDALISVYPDELKEFKALDKITLSQTDSIDMKIILRNIVGPTYRFNKDINTAYLENIKKLDSNKLSLIVESSKKGRIIRSPVTIHAIIDELFERSINDKKEDT